MIGICFSLRKMGEIVPIKSLALNNNQPSPTFYSTVDPEIFPWLSSPRKPQILHRTSHIETIFTILLYQGQRCPVLEEQWSTKWKDHDGNPFVWTNLHPFFFSSWCGRPSLRAWDTWYLYKRKWVFILLWGRFSSLKICKYIFLFLFCCMDRHSLSCDCSAKLSMVKKKKSVLYYRKRQTVQTVFLFVIYCTSLWFLDLHNGGKRNQSSFVSKPSFWQRTPHNNLLCFRSVPLKTGPPQKWSKRRKFHIPSRGISG